MIMKKTMKPLTIAVGVALSASLGAAVQAADNPFVATTLSSGYMMAGADQSASNKNLEAAAEEVAQKAEAEGKCGEGKCGEGKCGGDKSSAEGKCGEGKCGEGKCGGDK